MPERLHPRACVVCGPGRRQGCVRCGSKHQHAHVTVHDRTGTAMRSAAVCGAHLARLMGDDPDDGAQPLPAPDEPTARAVLTFVADYFARTGHAPAQREIAAGVGVGVATVCERLHRLRESGHVWFADGVARSLEVCS